MANPRGRGSYSWFVKLTRDTKISWQLLGAWINLKKCTQLARGAVVRRAFPRCSKRICSSCCFGPCESARANPGGAAEKLRLAKVEQEASCSHCDLERRCLHSCVLLALRHGGFSTLMSRREQTYLARCILMYLQKGTPRVDWKNIASEAFRFRLVGSPWCFMQETALPLCSNLAKFAADRLGK